MVPEPLVQSAVALERGPHGGGRALLRKEAAQAVFELALGVVQVEVHQASPASRVSRGSPSPRSAMMLRWMLDAPPAMALPREPKYWNIHRSLPRLASPPAPVCGRRLVSPNRSMAIAATRAEMLVLESLFIN